MSKFPLDEEAVRKLAAILQETGLTEIEVEAEDLKIRVAKGVSAFPLPVQSPAVAAGRLYLAGQRMIYCVGKK